MAPISADYYFDGSSPPFRYFLLAIASVSLIISSLSIVVVLCACCSDDDAKKKRKQQEQQSRDHRHRPSPASSTASSTRPQRKQKDAAKTPAVPGDNEGEEEPSSLIVPSASDLMDSNKKPTRGVIPTATTQHPKIDITKTPSKQICQLKWKRTTKKSSAVAIGKLAAVGGNKKSSVIGKIGSGAKNMPPLREEAKTSADAAVPPPPDGDDQQHTPASPVRTVVRSGAVFDAGQVAIERTYPLAEAVTFENPSYFTLNSGIEDPFRSFDERKKTQTPIGIAKLVESPAKKPISPSGTIGASRSVGSSTVKSSAGHGGSDHAGAGAGGGATRSQRAAKWNAANVRGGAVDSPSAHTRTISMATTNTDNQSAVSRRSKTLRNSKSKRGGR